MSKYVDADALCNKLQSEIIALYGNGNYGLAKGLGIAKTLVKDIPERDVVEVKHGKWQIVPYIDRLGFHCTDLKCSKCGYRLYQPLSEPNYCCYCGARMDGAE